MGRFGSKGYWMKLIRPSTLMGLFAIANVALVMVGDPCFGGWLGLWAIFLTSFFMSIMFPTIFALGLRDLGPNTKAGASLLVMAIIGGAVFTPMIGLVFQATRSMAVAMSVPLVCYVVVAVFAFWGSVLPARAIPARV